MNLALVTFVVVVGSLAAAIVLLLRRAPEGGWESQGGLSYWRLPRYVFGEIRRYGLRALARPEIVLLVCHFGVLGFLFVWTFVWAIPHRPH